jgi:flagellar hook-length control protein FliK
LQEPLATVDTLRSTAYQDLSNLIASHTRSGSYEITVRVQPEGMGNIFVSVSKETQGLRVSITADHPQTLQWMESGKHEVMQALQSLGVDVASVQLNLSQSGAFHQSFANQSHQSHGQSQHLVIDETSRGNPASDEAGPSTVDVSDFRHHDWRATTISVQV